MLCIHFVHIALNDFAIADNKCLLEEKVIFDRVCSVVGNSESILEDNRYALSGISI